jgi:hypothetical protein
MQRGEALHTIHYGTMPNGDPKAPCMGMADDAVALRAEARPARLASVRRRGY